MSINVPCGPCTACCRNEPVILLTKADTFPYLTDNHGTTVALKPNGECVYLDKGCMIHPHRPLACRAFDCRRAVHAHPEVMAVGKQLPSGGEYGAAIRLVAEKMEHTLNSGQRDIGFIVLIRRTKESGGTDIVSNLNNKDILLAMLDSAETIGKQSAPEKPPEV